MNAFKNNLDRSEILYLQTRYQDAADYARKAIEIEPEESAGYGYLSQALLGLEKLDDAENAIQTALSIDPEEPDWLSRYGDILSCKEQPDQALEFYFRALNNDPENAERYASIAAEKLSTNSNESVEWAKKGLQLDPENDACLQVLTLANLVTGRREASDESGMALLSNSPDKSETHLTIGLTALLRGRHEKAMEHLSEYLRSYPDDQVAIDLLREAILSKSIIYRLLLQFQLFIFDKPKSFLVACGVLVTVVIFTLIYHLYQIAVKYASIPFGIYAIFLFSNSINFFTAFLNLRLRLHPYGKWLQEPAERHLDLFVVIIHLLSIPVALLGLYLSENKYILAAAHMQVLATSLFILTTKTKSEFPRMVLHINSAWNTLSFLANLALAFLFDQYLLMLIPLILAFLTTIPLSFIADYYEVED